jgi:hypothetical protein
MPTTSYSYRLGIDVPWPFIPPIERKGGKSAQTGFKIEANSKFDRFALASVSEGVS